MLGIIIICQQLTHKFSEKQNHISSISLIFFMFCPITWFCSQKIWIDNALLMTVTLSVAIQLLLCSNISHESTRYANHMFSGLFFGLITLNTKLTGLALLPFHIIWIIFHRILSQTQISSQQQTHSSTQELLQTRIQIFIDIIKHVTLFLIFAFIGYSPWIYIYKTHTNLWLPNAWPTKSMIQNSKFLQFAINKPIYFYFYQLFTLSPIHLIGLLSTVALFCQFLFKYYQNSTFWFDNDRIYQCKRIILLLWPTSFLFCFTLLGYFGSSFQTRFILPITSVLSIFTAIEFEHCLENRSNTSMLMLLFGYTALHGIYYGVMFPTLYADLDDSLFDMLAIIMKTPHYIIPTKEVWDHVFNYLKHLGLNR